MSYLQSKLPEFSPAVVVEPWRKALMDAAELIRTRGHCKGVAIDLNTGSFCAVGAIGTAVVAHGLAGLSVRFALYDRVNRHVGGKGLPAWNDAPERTAEDVIRALEECARS